MPTISHILQGLVLCHSVYYSVEGQRLIKILGSKMVGSYNELMFFIAGPQTGLYIPVVLSLMSW